MDLILFLLFIWFYLGFFGAVLIDNYFEKNFNDTNRHSDIWICMTLVGPIGLIIAIVFIYVDNKRKRRL